MKKVSDMRYLLSAIVSLVALAVPAVAQQPGQYPPTELERLVSRIARATRSDSVSLLLLCL